MIRAILFAVWVSALGLPLPAQAQDPARTFPARPVSIVVPFAAGGAIDVIGRLLSDRLASAWKQPVLIVNRPGASGSIGAQQVAGSPPDGHTILFASTGLLQNVVLFPTLQIDPFRDFAPISEIVTSPVAFVVGSQSPSTTMADYIAMVRARTGQLSYGSFGAGTTSHIYGEQLKAVAKLDLTHVAYRGEAALLPDVISGTLTGAFVSVASAASSSKGGRVRVLAVTGTAPSKALPGVPTLLSQGLQGFEGIGWFGWFAPAATPKALVEQISRDVNQALTDPELVRRVNAAGMDAVGTTPDEFATVMRADFERWNRLIRQLGVKAE